MTEPSIALPVDYHFVIPDSHGQPFDVHTHGLELFEHKEFQVLVPGYCREAAMSLLSTHVDRVLNKGEKYKAGDTVTVTGVRCGYIEVAGDVEGDPTRLRIVDLPNSCKCEFCEATGPEQCENKHPPA